MRVLLIEGNIATAQSVAGMLKGQGICTDVTDTGEDGTDLCRRYDYDAVVMALRLPDMSSFDVIRNVRKANVTTPILVLTDGLSVDDQVKALKLGADCCMPKPLCHGELLARIRALVRRSRGHAHSAITTGSITVDMGAKTVNADGKAVHLTDMEYQILELLSLRRGTTLNKEILINHLYGGDGPDSRTIELFICRLRKKLSTATGGGRYIETVGRYGYLLRSPMAA